MTATYAESAGSVATGSRLSRRPRSVTPPDPHILVVDDDPDIPHLVEAAVLPYRLAIESATNGSDALILLNSKSYALVILDLALASLSGFDVLLSLKGDPILRHIPVLVLTGDSSDEALARSFGYGADDLVIKPFNAPTLGIRVYRLIPEEWR